MTRAPRFLPRSNSWQVSCVMPPPPGCRHQAQDLCPQHTGHGRPLVTICKDRTAATHGPGGDSLANTWSQVVQSFRTFPSWRNQGSEDT